MIQMHLLKKSNADTLPVRFMFILTQAEGIVLQMQAKQIYRFLKPMASLIYQQKVTRQYAIESQPYRVCYVTEKGKYVYKSMPVANV